MSLWACVLIRTLHGAIEKVRESIQKLPFAVEVFMVHGRYDIVAFFNGSNHEEVSNMVRAFHGISGVLKTETVIEMK